MIPTEVERVSLGRSENTDHPCANILYHRIVQAQNGLNRARRNENEEETGPDYAGAIEIAAENDTQTAQLERVAPWSCGGEWIVRLRAQIFCSVTLATA